MNIERGSVVRAKAGRDKGGYFVVIKMDIKSGRAYIADGKRRKVEKPKCKNIIHLEPVKAIADTDTFTNRYIREFINKTVGNGTKGG